MIGFYVKGSVSERETQLAELFCFAMLYRLNEQKTALFEDDEYEWEAFNFMVKHPVISHLIITSPEDLLLNEDEFEKMNIVLQSAQIELINLGEKQSSSL